MKFNYVGFKEFNDVITEAQVIGWLYGRFPLTRPDRSERSNCWMEHKTFWLPTYLTGKFR
jgi:hypothetical protein